MSDQLTMQIWKVGVDGKNHSVPIPAAAQSAWDRTRLERGWPVSTEVSGLWMSYLSWFACRRAGKIPEEMSFDAFDGLVEVIEPTKEQIVVGPTKGAATPG